MVSEIVGRLLNIPANKLTDADGLYRTDGWDSLMHIEIADAIEEAYGIRIADEQLESLNGLAALKSFVGDQKMES